MFALALAVLSKRIFKVDKLCPLEVLRVDFCFQHVVYEAELKHIETREVDPLNRRQSS